MVYFLRNISCAIILHACRLLYCVSRLRSRVIACRFLATRDPFDICFCGFLPDPSRRDVPIIDLERWSHARLCSRRSTNPIFPPHCRSCVSLLLHHITFLFTDNFRSCNANILAGSFGIPRETSRWIFMRYINLYSWSRFCILMQRETRISI